MTSNEPESGSGKTDTPTPPPGAQRVRGRARPDNAEEATGAASRPLTPDPVLVRLAQLYPHLFGQQAAPLKRGIFQDLQSAHPDAFERDALKAALARHTRSTRYLTAVAAGLARQDLAGNTVEAMAPEHVYHALLEVFRRRHQRRGEDLRPKLQQRMIQAYESSGLTRKAYLTLVHSRDEEANSLLDAALTEATARAAKDEALLRAFDSSHQDVEAFADMYGMQPQFAARTLEQARRRRAAAATVLTEVAKSGGLASGDGPGQVG